MLAEKSNYLLNARHTSAIGDVDKTANFALDLTSTNFPQSRSESDGETLVVCANYRSSPRELSRGNASPPSVMTLETRLHATKSCAHPFIAFVLLGLDMNCGMDWCRYILTEFSAYARFAFRGANAP